MALAYKRPAHFFAVPADERERRVYCNDDLCVIDGRDFLIRGVIELPIRGSQEHFEWGVWALVEEADFYRYVDAWRQDTEEEVPPFGGRVSGSLTAYPATDMLDLTIYR